MKKIILFIFASIFLLTIFSLIGKISFAKGGCGITAPDNPGGQYTLCSSENQNCYFNGYTSIAFGKGDKWIYKDVDGTSVSCNTNTFGDPAGGCGKSCYKYTYPTEPGAPFTLCANEGGSCHLDGIGYIYYGAPGRWRFKSYTGQAIGRNVGCYNSEFYPYTDPAPGTVKKCYMYQPSQIVLYGDTPISSAGRGDPKFLTDATPEFRKIALGFFRAWDNVVSSFDVIADSYLQSQISLTSFAKHSCWQVCEGDNYGDSIGNIGCAIFGPGTVASLPARGIDGNRIRDDAMNSARPIDCPPPPALKITFSAASSTITGGSKAYFYIYVSNGKTCTLSGTDIDSITFDASQTPSPSYSSKIINNFGTSNITSSFNLTCGWVYNNDNRLSQDVSVTVTPHIPPVLINSSILANPSKIYSGKTTQLSWNAVSAASTKCIINNGIGNVSLSGWTQTNILNATTTFVLSCSNSTYSTTSSVTVDVQPIPKPKIFTKNKGTAFIWDETGVDNCTLKEGDLVVANSTSGYVESDIADQFTLSCDGGPETLVNTNEPVIKPTCSTASQNYVNQITTWTASPAKSDAIVASTTWSGTNVPSTKKGGTIFSKIYTIVGAKNITGVMSGKVSSTDSMPFYSICHATTTVKLDPGTNKEI